MFSVFIFLTLDLLCQIMLNSLRSNITTMKLLITDIFGCCDKAKVRNDVIFRQ